MSTNADAPVAKDQPEQQPVVGIHFDWPSGLAVWLDGALTGVFAKQWANDTGNRSPFLHDNKVTLRPDGVFEVVFGVSDRTSVMSAAQRQEVLDLLRPRTTGTVAAHGSIERDARHHVGTVVTLELQSGVIGTPDGEPNVPGASRVVMDGKKVMIAMETPSDNKAEVAEFARQAALALGLFVQNTEFTLYDQDPRAQLVEAFDHGAPRRDLCHA